MKCHGVGITLIDGDDLIPIGAMVFSPDPWQNGFIPPRFFPCLPFRGHAKDKQEKRQDILDRVAVAWFDTHEETGDDADNIRYKEDMLKPIKVKSHPKKNKKSDIDEN
jgi:hypothetical protein